jgi:hypothetical protein
VCSSRPSRRPGTANYLKEFKVTELLEGGGSSEGTLPLREHRALKTALAREDYKQATADFKALFGHELKWDGVADGQVALKNDKVKELLVRNSYGFANEGYSPSEHTHAQSVCLCVLLFPLLTCAYVLLRLCLLLVWTW